MLTQVLNLIPVTTRKETRVKWALNMILFQLKWRCNYYSRTSTHRQRKTRCTAFNHVKLHFTLWTRHGAVAAATEKQFPVNISLLPHGRRTGRNGTRRKVNHGLSGKHFPRDRFSCDSALMDRLGGAACRTGNSILLSRANWGFQS